MSVAHFGTTEPYKVPARTRAAAKARVDVRVAADGRAANKAAAAAFVRALRETEPDVSVADAHARLVGAVATRSGPFAALAKSEYAPYLCAPADPSTLYRWLVRAARAEAAGASVADALADAPGRGRTRRLLPEPLRRTVQRLAGLRRYPVRDIVARAQDYARARGYAAGGDDWPTAHKVRRAMDDLGQVFHTAAAQGSQAARLDAVVHAAVPADHPHQVWTGDTFKCPLPARGLDEAAHARGDANPYVAYPVEVVVFADNHNEAVVSYYVTDPRGRMRVGADGERLDERDDAAAVGPVTAVEALGALLSAALPELAPPGTRDVAGRLPSKALRLDVAMQQMLRGPLAIFPGLVPALPGNYPPARGLIERLIGKLKARMAALPGAAPVYVVPDQTEAADARDRVRQAPKKVRPRPTIHIAPRDLPDIDGVRAVVDAVIREHNHTPGAVTPDNPRGWSPAQRLAAALRDTHGRPGTDALRLMKFGDVLAQKGAVVHRKAVFAHSPTLGVAPADGSPVVAWGVRQVVEFRADPLLRGLFAFPRHAPVGDTRFVFLSRLAEAAREADPALVARAQRDEARAASQAARAARDETQELEIGLAGMHNAHAAGAAAEIAAGWGRKGRPNGSGTRGKSARTGTKTGAPKDAAPKGKAANATPGTAPARKPATKKPARPKTSIAPAADRTEQTSLALAPGVAPPTAPVTHTAAPAAAPVAVPAAAAPAVDPTSPAPATPPVAVPQPAPEPALAPAATPADADPAARRVPAFTPPLRWGLAGDPRARVRGLTASPQAPGGA